MIAAQNFVYTNKKVEGLYYPCSKIKAVVRVGSLFLWLCFHIKNGVSLNGSYYKVYKMLVCVLKHSAFKILSKIIVEKLIAAKATNLSLIKLLFKLH